MSEMREARASPPTEPRAPLPGLDQHVPPAPSRLVARLEGTLGLAAALALFAMMAVTVVDVAGRYLFAAPLPAGYELIQFGMGACVFLILPVVVARGENVTVEMIPFRRGPRLAAVMAAAAAIVSAAMLAFFGAELWARAETFRVSGETSHNLRLPLAPFAYFMALVWFTCAPIALVVGLAPRRRPPRSDPS
jgi:TRAP-type C4-dicarboxylate transport system permease small subunit